MLALLLGTLALTSCSQQAQGPTQGDAGSADEVVATHQLGFEAFNLRDPADVRRLLERRNHRVLWYASSGVVDSGTIPYRAGNYYCGYADGILWFDQWVMYPAGSPTCGTL